MGLGHHLHRHGHSIHAIVVLVHVCAVPRVGVRTRRRVIIGHMPRLVVDHIEVRIAPGRIRIHGRQEKHVGVQVRLYEALSIAVVLGWRQALDLGAHSLFDCGGGVCVLGERERKKRRGKS